MLSETTRTCRGVNVKWFYLLLYSMATKNHFAFTHQYFLLYGVTNNMCLHWFVLGAFCSKLQRNEINGRKWHCANASLLRRECFYYSLDLHNWCHSLNFLNFVYILIHLLINVQRVHCLYQEVKKSHIRWSRAKTLFHIYKEVASINESVRMNIADVWPYCVVSCYKVTFLIDWLRHIVYTIDQGSIRLFLASWWCVFWPLLCSKYMYYSADRSSNNMFVVMVSSPVLLYKIFYPAMYWQVSSYQQKREYSHKPQLEDRHNINVSLTRRYTTCWNIDI